MKKLLSLCFCASITICSFAQKKMKTNFGFEFGLPFINMSPSTKGDNPIVQGDKQWSPGMGYCGGAFIEFIKSKTKSDGNIVPGYGFKLKAIWSYIELGNNDVYYGETMKLRMLTIPAIFKICLSSHEIAVSASRDADQYEIKKGSSANEYEVWKYPGQYHAGYRTTRSVFFYFGPQWSSISNVSYESDKTNFETGFAAIQPNIKTSEIAIAGGLELWVGRTIFDISYQKGLTSIYNDKKVFLQGIVGKVAIAF